jgi:hypothetical protein
MLGRGVGSAPWVWGKTLQDAEEAARIMNARRGIDARQAMEIEVSSMRASFQK